MSWLRVSGGFEAEGINWGYQLMDFVKLKLKLKGLGRNYLQIIIARYSLLAWRGRSWVLRM